MQNLLLQKELKQFLQIGGLLKATPSLMQKTWMKQQKLLKHALHLKMIVKELYVSTKQCQCKDIVYKEVSPSWGCLFFVDKAHLCQAVIYLNLCLVFKAISSKMNVHCGVV